MSSIGLYLKKFKRPTSSTNKLRFNNILAVNASLDLFTTLFTVVGVRSEQQMVNDDLGSSNLSLPSSFSFEISDHHVVYLPLESSSDSKYTNTLVSSLDERNVTVSAINPML